MTDKYEEKPTTAEEIEAQNERNLAAGLPPVSNDLKSPATNEDALGPLYPRMTEIMDAAYNEAPIPVAEEVSEIEKPSSSGDIRKFIDTVDDTQEKVEDFDPGVVHVGGTTLSEWRDGADSTKIEGGVISTDSISMTGLRYSDGRLELDGKWSINTLDNRPEFVELQKTVERLRTLWLVNSAAIIIICLLLIFA